MILGKLQNEIKETLEQVGSRERHINLQLESQLSNYRQLSQVSNKVCQVDYVHLEADLVYI